MLRKLMEKDAEGMLEWMHDADINQFFRFDAANMTIEKAVEYIKKANESDTDRHYAIVDEKDEYLGTISLKNIDFENLKAEYAISTRTKAHGTGCAAEATLEILKMAFSELNLEKVYLNVLSDNVRANKFYNKMGFVYDGEFRRDLKIRDKFYDLKWYSILKSEFIKK